jgi:hypothetical protein
LGGDLAGGGGSGPVGPWLEKKAGGRLYLLLPVPVLLGYLAGRSAWRLGFICLYMVPTCGD